MEIGAQLYTVRAFTKTPEDLRDTLHKVADIGYRNVQISKTCPFEAEWMRDLLKECGLTCVLTHVPPERLLNETDAVIREHEIFGSERIGLGKIPLTEPEKDYPPFIETWSAVGRKIREGGKYFLYHNHDQEFQKIGNKTILEKILEDVPAEDMGIIFDAFWAQVGGADPAQWLEEHLKGRVPCIHLKDCGYNKRMDALGEGNMNLPRIFEKAEVAGTKYLLVEQDKCNDEDPFDCLERSYRYLRSFGFQ